jgi:hypothetical protein
MAVTGGYFVKADTMSSGMQNAQNNPQGGVGGGFAETELKGIGIGQQQFREGDTVKVQGQVVKILPNGTAVIEIARGWNLCAPAESCERVG